MIQTILSVQTRLRAQIKGCADIPRAVSAFNLELWCVCGIRRSVFTVGGAQTALVLLLCSLDSFLNCTFAISTARLLPFKM